MNLRSFILISLFLIGLAFNAVGYQRVIVLNTAVSLILVKMGVEDYVVGVTYNDEVFPNKTKIGSHLSPNYELIKALRPDLIIAGSKKAFPTELKKRFNADVFRHDPRNLEAILDSVAKLGKLFKKERIAQQIIDEQRAVLAAINNGAHRKGVVFEISQRPLKVAGKENIITSIITAAGGKNVVSIPKKHVLISPEKVLEMNPVLYVYQNGPMNKNPVHPKKRNYFRMLKSKVFEVDQLEFTRPGLNAFEAVVKLNKIMNSNTNH